MINKTKNLFLLLTYESDTNLKPIEGKILKETLHNSINIFIRIKVQIQRIHKFHSDSLFISNTLITLE